MRGRVTYKFFFLATIFNTDVWLATLAENRKCLISARTSLSSNLRPMNRKRYRIIISTCKRSMKSDLRVLAVHGDLVLCGITDKTLVVRERDIRRGCAVSLIVCNDFYMIVLPHTNTTRRYMNQYINE